MAALLYALGALSIVLGLAGIVLPALPGAPLLAIGAALVGWADGFTRVSGWTVAALVAISAAMWAADVLAGILGAKAFGASRWAVVGGALGLIVGLFFGPLGIVLGPVIGAIALELARDPDLRKALRAGVGTFVGFVVGTAVKVALAFVFLGVLILALVV